MSIFEKVGESISSTGKGVVGKARSASDISKVKRQIIYEEQKCSEIYTKIGKLFFEKNLAPPNEQFRKLFQDVEERVGRVGRLRREICVIKGIKVCEGCGAEIAKEFQFCGICGTRLPDPIIEPELDDGFFVFDDGDALSEQASVDGAFTVVTR